MTPLPVVLDAGAFIALEQRDQRVLAVADGLRRSRTVGHVPAGVLAQIWRGSPRQHGLTSLLRSSLLRVDPLTDVVAFRVGLLLGATGTSDVVDGHVALLARRLQATVLTSDPDDIAALDSTLRIVRV